MVLNRTTVIAGISTSVNLITIALLLLTCRFMESFQTAQMGDHIVVPANVLDRWVEG